MLYLVRGSITKFGLGSIHEDWIDIVEAESETEVYDKYKKWVENKSKTNGPYYHLNYAEVREMIV